MNLKTFTTLFLFSLFLCGISRFALAGKRRVEIPDELDDVFDNEEDEAWKEWGKKPEPSFAPADFTKLDSSQIKDEMMKRHAGPVIGFVKLRLGDRRNPDAVAELAMKWTQVLRTGAVGVRFMGVDLNTIMFNMESMKDLEELKEFVLDQSEAYEIKMGEQFFRRPGDPPLDEVTQKRNSEKGKAENAGPRYKFHSSNSGSLITFLRVASLSSTKLLKFNPSQFLLNHLNNELQGYINYSNLEKHKILTVVSALGVLAFFEASSALLP